MLQWSEQKNKFRDDNDDDDITEFDHHYSYIGHMLDLIFVKVESSSQLLSEIYGICLDT